VLPLIAEYNWLREFFDISDGAEIRIVIDWNRPLSQTCRLKVTVFRNVRLWYALSMQRLQKVFKFGNGAEIRILVRRNTSLSQTCWPERTVFINFHSW
jgi:hypothetical protein